MLRMQALGAPVCLVVSNLAHASTEDDLSTIFSNYALIQGQVTEDGTQCIGFVFLQSMDEARRAINDLDRSFYDSRRIRVVLLSDFEKDQTGGKSHSGSERPAKRRKHNNDADLNRTDLTNLYVCPVPTGISEASLTQIFSQYGRVRKVTILHRHRGGKSVAGKPGFVDFHQNVDARTCIQNMNGRPLSEFFPGASTELTFSVRFSDSHSRNDPNNKKKMQQSEKQTVKTQETLTYPTQPDFASLPEPTLTEKEKELTKLLEEERMKNQQLMSKLSLCGFCLTKNQHLLTHQTHNIPFTTRTAGDITS